MFLFSVKAFVLKNVLWTDNHSFTKKPVCRCWNSVKDLWRQPYHVVLEIENKDCTIVKRLASLGVEHLKVVDIRSSQRHSVKHMVEFDPEELKRIPREIRIIRPKSRDEAKSSAWFESKGCSICNAILSSDAFLISGKSLDNSKIIYTFMVPSFEGYKQIMRKIEKAGYTVTVLRIGRFEPRKGILTAKQERIFWLALKGGFFDYPRKIGILELATKLGISSATLSEIIRRGMRRLLENHFKNESVQQ